MHRKWLACRKERLVWIALSSLGALALAGGYLARAVGSESLIGICWGMISRILASAAGAPLTLSAGPLVGLFLLGSFAFAAVRTLIRWVKTQRLIASAKYVENNFLDAAFFTSLQRRVPGFQTTGIRILDLTDPVAFTAGLLRPRVYLSRGLLRVLQREETLSVLLQELGHVKRRDPLRWVAVDLLAFALWFLPISSFLKRKFAELSEQAADEHAVAAGVSPLDLACALVKVGKAKASSLVLSTAGLDGGAPLSWRVERLIGRKNPSEGAKPGRKTLWASVAVSLLLVLSAQVTISMGGAAGEHQGVLVAFEKMMQACTAPLV